MALALFFGPAQRSLAEENGLTGCWHFDEGQGDAAKDSSGNANHGKIRGAKWLEGISGKALCLDGIDDYVDCGTNVAASIENSSYTVEIWAKPSGPLTGDHYLMSCENMRIGLSERSWTFWQGTPGWDSGYQAASGSLTPDKWHHVVGVFDRDKSIRLYVNGVSESEGKTGIGSPRMRGATYIGTSRTAKKRFFAGVIDEVKIYSRALSEDEIKERYGSPGKEMEARTPVEESKASSRVEERLVLPTEEELEKLGVAYVRFGISADPHVRSPGGLENKLRDFVRAMGEWKPDFIVDMGDFAVQVSEGPTTPESHDGQLANLKRTWGVYSSGPFPAHVVMGNHDVGWIKGGDEVVTPADLCAARHPGEDITKQEFLTVTGSPHRYFSFDVKRYHFIVLDGNNDPTVMQDVPRGHDHGIKGGYCIDRKQLAWLADDLAANHGKTKVVFCHEELHLTPPQGSGEGGDVPFPQVGKAYSYVDNGWQVRDMLTSDGEVLACFFGHKHRNRWAVYGGVNYITLAATHWNGSYSQVIISDKLYIKGAAEQRSYSLPVPARLQGRTSDALIEKR